MTHCNCLAALATDEMTYGTFIISKKESVMSNIWLSISTFIAIILFLVFLGVFFFAAH